jgi:hypothetical protein
MNGWSSSLGSGTATCACSSTSHSSAVPSVTAGVDSAELVR